jgi:hypothetical protein
LATIVISFPARIEKFISSDFFFFCISKLSVVFYLAFC